MRKFYQWLYVSLCLIFCHRLDQVVAQRGIGHLTKVNDDACLR